MSTPQQGKKRGLRRMILRVAYYSFLVGGSGGLGFASFVFADAYRYQAQQQRAFTSARADGVSLRTAPRIAVDGRVVGEMDVTRLGIKVVVAQGDTEEILSRAVGHLPETAMPGDVGNVVLAGHRDSFFRPLRNVRGGDVITLKTLNGEYQYRVASTEIVSPDDLSSLLPTNEPTLTLITCYPFYYIGPAPKRFVVRAHLAKPQSNSNEQN